MSVAFTNQQWWLNHTQIPRSLRFNSADTAYLSWTPGSAGNRKTWTWSGWVKRCKTGQGFRLFGQDSYPSYTICGFTSGDKLYCVTVGEIVYMRQSIAVYRDTSAWYHVTIVHDTTDATTSNRYRFYVNGSLVATELGEGLYNYPAQNTDGSVNAALLHHINYFPYGGASSAGDGYLADIHFIDGQALEPTAFGQFDENGDWQKIPYEGTYGTNGFHLPFTDNSSAAALGTDTSGNGNTWTVNNISVAAGAGNDSLVDTPTNYGTDTGAGGEVRGNYATFNPIDSPNNTSGALTNGNLDFAGNSAAYSMYRGTVEIPATGKWFYECQFNGTASSPRGSQSQYSAVGVCKTNVQVATVVDGNSLWMGDSGFGCNFSGTRTDFAGQAIDSGDIVGVAINRDANTFEFFLNGVSIETGTIGVASGVALSPYAFCYSNIQTTLILNFGQRPWAFPAPSGFKALCTQNLPDPTIADPSTVMDVVLDTGANILTAAQGAIGGSADLLWIKDRANANNHQLIDTVRGGTATLQSNTNAAETTYSAPSGSSVAWTWDAGSSTVTNNDGTITSQVRANPSAGFSIVTYTVSASSQTVGHGLGVAPAMSIAKRRNSTGGDWYVRFKGGSFDGYLILNSTAAGTTSANGFTSTTVPCAYLSTSNEEWVLYNFAPVEGYSAFGSYIGNGSADGPFVYTGFRPRWVLIRGTGGGYWVIKDALRAAEYNPQTGSLYADLSQAEDTVAIVNVDFLSNGFKLRGNYGSVNASATTYIYAAFAEHPLKTSRAR